MINKTFAAAFFIPGVKKHCKELNAIIRMMGKALLLESHAQWIELEASIKNIEDILIKQLGMDND